MIWAQSLDGRAVDLVHPEPAGVAFDEIARTLARIPRYTGATARPVSVALHTIIAFDAAAGESDAVRAHVLLHDCHEARIGDIATPVAQALAAVAGGAPHDNHAKATVKAAIVELKGRHDIAIWQGAGLDLPTADEHVAIRRADLVALQTERAAFLAAPPRPWAPEVETVAPLPNYAARAKSLQGLHPDDCAAELMALFRTHLPVFARP